MIFDLNIDNYTRDELIQVFELPANFDKNILEIQESKLLDSITNSTEINKDIQIKTIKFLFDAKNIILNTSPIQKSGQLQRKIEDFYNTSYELKTTELEEPAEHMVQLRKEKPYLSSYPSEFFPGVINPLKKRTVKKNLNIDSRFRENYYSSPASNFNIILPTNFNDVIQMQLAGIELPTTFYVVSKQYGNNFFSLIVNGSELKVINIPSGNYTQVAIMELINTQLQLAGPPYNYVSFTINLVANSGTGQTMVGPNGTGTVTDIELNFQADKFGIDDRGTPLPLKFGWLLGFRNSIYVGNLNYVSESLVDLTGPRYLFLVVNDYNNSVNNNFFSAFTSSILNKNILARISVQANAFDILGQNNLSLITTPREYFGPVNINSLNIQLLDEYGRIIDINNMDFSFCITLTTIYDI